MRSPLGKTLKLGPLHLTPTPLSLFLLILVLVFVIEAVVMILLLAFPKLSSRPVFLVALDATLLVSALGPALWLLFVRPIRQLAIERGQLLRSHISIQEAERSRLSQELHDELGQIQTAILLTSKAGASASSLDIAREHAGTVHQLAASAIDALRRLARGLSPTVLKDFGLTIAVERLGEDLSSTDDFRIEVRSNLGNQRLPAEVELAAYRAVQEALVNAAKHAGPGIVKVNLAISSGEFMFTITDNGQGFNPSTRPDAPPIGLGLRGIQERLSLLRGSFEVRSRSGEGTTLIGRLPAEIVSP